MHARAHARISIYLDMYLFYFILFIYFLFYFFFFTCHAHNLRYIISTFVRSFGRHFYKLGLIDYVRRILQNMTMYRI